MKVPFMWNPPDPKTYNAQVWFIASHIPEGSVTTYGHIASMIPVPDGSNPDEYKRLGARWVGSAMRDSGSQRVPWQRVINSKGEISLPKGSAGAEKQRRLLEMEGVVFNDKGRVDLKHYGWVPDEAWLAENELDPPKSY